MTSQNDLYVVGQHGVLYEGLSRYSNNIELVGLSKCPYYRYLTKKMMSQILNEQSLPHTSWRDSRGKTAVIDVACRNFVTVTLCIAYKN